MIDYCANDCTDSIVKGFLMRTFSIVNYEWGEHCRLLIFGV